MEKQALFFFFGNQATTFYDPKSIVTLEEQIGAPLIKRFHHRFELTDAGHYFYESSVYRDILMPDGIPQIVPQNLFDRVQARMEKNRKSPARNKAEDFAQIEQKGLLRHGGGSFDFGDFQIRL